MPLHLPVPARSLRALLLHRPVPRAPRQSPAPHRMRRPHSSAPRRRSPPLFRRSRKNPPHRQRRQHPPLEPLRPPPRKPSRIPRPASRPNQLRVLRHPPHPTPHPRPNPLTRSGHFQVAPSGAAHGLLFIALWHSHRRPIPLFLRDDSWLCAFLFLHPQQSLSQDSSDQLHRLNPNPKPIPII